VDQVTPEFVDEAFKLLRQSIISVEKDDVEFEDEDAEMADADAGAADQDGDSPIEDAAGSTRASQTPAPPRPRTQIKYDDYIKIHNLLLRRVNDDQGAAEDGVEENDLLIWYLEQKEQELESQEDMEQQRSLARKVLKRMVKVSFNPMSGSV
jgi:DNA replication licensing factor MCM6